MKKNLKSLLAILMAAAMIFALAACGSSSAEPAASAADSAAAPAEASAAEEAPADANAKVLNIWCWNDEFQSRFNDYYPEVKEVAADKSTTTLNDGTIVKWTINPNDDNNYQNKLDEALLKQDSVADNEKIDIFLIEADYALKYVDSDYTMPIADLGITDADLADQYQYTKDIVSVGGVQKGTTWQATPGLFAYRRSIAKDVLGTDDPDQVQEALSDWSKFNDVAEKAAEKGYFMLSGYDDAYRTFSNNVSAPWVDGTTVKVDPNLMTWVEQTKEFTDKGYNNKTSLWDTSWNAQQTINGNTFGFFFSTWGINFTLAGNAEIKNDAGENLVGKYRVCEGPASYYWGGTWIAAAAGTDNKSQILDIMKKLTCDATIAEKITRDTLDYTNNKTAMNKLANDPKYGSDFLGGQNHVALFAQAAPKIDMSNISAYDQTINEKLQEAMKDYFVGTVTEDKAWENFYKKVTDIHKELSK